MVLRLVGVVLGSLAVAGCHHAAGIYHTPDSETEQQIAQAAASISQSLSQLQAMEEMSRPKAAQKVLAPPTQAIAGNASIDWSGPIQALLDRLANTSGYRLRTVGTAPSVPILISLQSHDAPLAEMLREVDFQAGSRARVRVYPQERIIELRYVAP